MDVRVAKILVTIAIGLLFLIPIDCMTRSVKVVLGEVTSVANASSPNTYQIVSIDTTGNGEADIIVASNYEMNGVNKLSKGDFVTVKYFKGIFNRSVMVYLRE